ACWRTKTLICSGTVGHWPRHSLRPALSTTQIAVIFCETSKPTKQVIDEPPIVRITGQRRPDRGTIGRSGANRDYRMSTYGLLPHSTHCYGRGRVDLATRRRSEGSPRDLRGFGSCERQFWRREPKEPKPCRPFPSKNLRISRVLRPKRGRPNPLRQGRVRSCPLRSSPRSRRALLIRSRSKPPVKAEEPQREGVTKQEHMLTLLSRPDGASIAEMMR